MLTTTLDEQRERHRTRVERALRLPVQDYVVSPHTEHYRARIHLRPNAEGQLGYNPTRSHEIVPVDVCAIARPEIGVVLRSLTPVHASIASVELRSDGDKVVVSVQSQRGERAAARTWLDALEPDQWSGVAIALNGRAIRGTPSTRLVVAGIEHTLSATTFYQVNLEINSLLVAEVRDQITALSPDRVLDLYAGAGNLSLPLAAAGVPTSLLEGHPAAAKDARATAARHKLDVEIRAERAEQFRAGDAAFDVAIVDPPRAGARGLLDEILTTRPRAVLMVSCNPITLAQDLQRARGHGYHMTQLRLYEMFPHTHHVEVMGMLVRS